jgi:hypothetical protein
MNAINATAPDTHQDGRDEIARGLRLLLEPGQVVELRCLNTTKGTVSGYFDDFDKLLKEIQRIDGKVPAVYLTLNPVNPALLARSKNRLKPYAKQTTSDTDIIRRRWLPIDFDPVRPAGISSTNEEHNAAIARARDVQFYLVDLGFPCGVVADSGNGAHLLQRIDSANDEPARKLIEGCLKALDKKFSDDKVKVDLTTYNAARIWKCYGTLACKGDLTPDRPHRRARILEG